MAEAPQQTPTERPDAPVATLRARLRELTLRDEHRLVRRLDKLRRTADGDKRAAELAGLVREIVQAEARVERPHAAVPKVSYPPELPVSARRDVLLPAIRDIQVVLVAGE